MNYRFKTPPYHHQVRELKRAWAQGHYGALWEPGTGKTKFIIDWASALFLAGKIKSLLVICPLSVVGVWEEEFETHCPIDYTLNRVNPKDGTPEWARWSPQLFLSVCVINYDLAWRRKELIETFAPDMVVADESQRIKRPGARRTNFVVRLNNAPYRAILTGTPTPKSYLDIFSQWKFLNPMQFGERVTDFKHRYIVYGGFMKKQIVGYNNIKELKAGIKADAGVVLKKDALDLPPQVFQRVPVDLEPKARKHYDTMAHQLFLELERGDISDAKNAAVKILRLQQITGGWIKSDEGNIHQISSAKLDATHDLLEDLFNDGQRVVVFARFIPEVRALADIGAQQRVPTYVLSGATRSDDRDRIRREFQTKDGPSLWVSQIQTGGLGITLHRSSQVIFYSVTYAYDDYKQACDRVHRSGQTNKVTYRHLVARSTIDLDVYSALRHKRDLMRVILDDHSVVSKYLTHD